MEDSAGAELAERAGKLFSGRVEFIRSVPALEFLPDPDVPEIAFCGRSNVGKSSLLNALTGRRSIARIAAMEANCFCATGNINPRMMTVSSMIARPKLPTSAKRWLSSQRIGFSRISNQPQSIARLKLGMPAFS